MDINGKIIAILPLQSGQGRSGQWKKQEFVIQTSGQYPRSICFNLWGEKIDNFSLKLDQEVKVHFELESREYNNRWYTEAKAWKVEGADNTADYAASNSAPEETTYNPKDDNPEDEIEDFPF